MLLPLIILIFFAVCGDAISSRYSLYVGDVYWNQVLILRNGFTREILGVCADVDKLIWTRALSLFMQIVLDEHYKRWRDSWKELKKNIPIVIPPLEWHLLGVMYDHSSSFFPFPLYHLTFITPFNDRFSPVKSSFFYLLLFITLRLCMVISSSFSFL